jgi:hypothetical protein
MLMGLPCCARPCSIFLGPFVNDAINDITKKKAEETTAYSDIHFSVKQEREADVVSLRYVPWRISFSLDCLD